jgi:hypothetical protein
VALPAGAAGTREGTVQRYRRTQRRVQWVFDVFASRGNEFVFAEAKLARKDRLRSTQRRWIASALAASVRIEDLLIVEWEFAK